MLAHELLGHGLGLRYQSETWDHIDAIQLSNLSLRVSGSIFQRNGVNHPPGDPLPKNIYSGIPSHFNY